MCCEWRDYRTRTHNTHEQGNISARAALFSAALTERAGCSSRAGGGKKIKQTQKEEMCGLFSPAWSTEEEKKRLPPKTTERCWFSACMSMRGEGVWPSNTLVSLILQGAGRLIRLPHRDGRPPDQSRRAFCCEQRQTAAKIRAGNGTVPMVCQCFVFFCRA